MLHDLARLQALLAAGQDTRFPLGEQDFAARLAPASRLVGRDAEILVLRERCSLQYAEIAAELGFKNEDTARALHHRALRKLEDMLAQGG